MDLTTPSHHCESVGSLLRPPTLVRAQARLRAGTLDPARLCAIEDAAVDEAIAIQEDAGLQVVTDGEMRRGIFFDHFVRGTTGLSPGLAQTVAFRAADADAAGFSVDVPFVVTERLRVSACPALDELTYASARASRPVKVTLPSPMMVFAFWNPQVSRDAYADPFDLARDAAAVVGSWMRSLAAAGCTHIQIDAPELAEVFADEVVREDYRSRGIDPRTMMDVGVELLAGLGDLELPGVTRSVHVCKGNGTQSFIAAGSYDAFAEMVFTRATGFDAFHLEYDDERSGSFEALSRLPDDTLAVLGLVSTKWRALEDADRLIARIEEAARFHPRERLGIATQCGFASAAETAADRRVTEQAQADKLALVARVARTVWG